MLALLLTSLFVAPTTVTFKASDGVIVYADLYPSSKGKTAPTLFLFHQMNSNAAEYGPIAPRLQEMGYNCLAVDARGGAERWNATNRTVKDSKKRLQFPEAMVEGYKDVNAAMDWATAEGFTGKRGVWGSSYSAAMVFLLAKDRKDVDAVLSFSPVNHTFYKYPSLDGIDVPVFVTMPPNEQSLGKQTFEWLPMKRKTLFLQKMGVHGSSALVRERNLGGTEPIWNAVIAFLNENLPAG